MLRGDLVYGAGRQPGSNVANPLGEPCADRPTAGAGSAAAVDQQKADTVLAFADKIASPELR
jgi:hypothetical protein